jgi:hypothetical protein
VGLFNACSMQWGFDASINTWHRVTLGVQYGGFLSACQHTHSADGHTTEAAYERVKGCVRRMCDDAFGQREHMRTVLAACTWFVDWYEAADNPLLSYRRVACPSALNERAGTTGP